MEGLVDVGDGEHTFDRSIFKSGVGECSRKALLKDVVSPVISLEEGCRAPMDLNFGDPTVYRHQLHEVTPP